MQKNTHIPLFQIYEVCVNGETFFYGKGDRDQILQLRKIHNQICEETNNTAMKMRVWILVRWKGVSKREYIPEHIQ